MEINQSAKELFQEYRHRMESEVERYNQLKTRFPLVAFKKTAASIWRLGMLAQAWAEVATALSGGKIDFMNKWRQGL